MGFPSSSRTCGMRFKSCTRSVMMRWSNLKQRTMSNVRWQHSCLNWVQTLFHRMLFVCLTKHRVAQFLTKHKERMQEIIYRILVTQLGQVLSRFKLDLLPRMYRECYNRG